MFGDIDAGGEVRISSVEEGISCIMPPWSWVTKVLVHQPGSAPLL